MAKSRLQNNIALSLLNKLSSIIIPVIAIPYISRVLGPEALGRLSFAQSVSAIFVVIASVGVPLYGAREVSRVRDDNEKLSNLVVELMFLNVVFSCLSFVVLSLIIKFSGKISSDPMLFWICSVPVLCTPLSVDWVYTGR